MIRNAANLALIIILLLSLNCSSDRVISDEEMIKNFQENKVDFEKLRLMATEEPNVMRIDYDFNWLKDNTAFPRPKSYKALSEERWNEYRSLFKKLKLDHGIVYYQLNGEVHFFYIEFKRVSFQHQRTIAVSRNPDGSE